MPSKIALAKNSSAICLDTQLKVQGEEKTWNKKAWQHDMVPMNSMTAYGK
jgi:hypothetical protein